MASTEALTYKPHTYQEAGIRWITSKPKCALFWGMGLGKSVVTLTAVQELMDYCEITKVLVIAPKKVAEATWTTEAQKWKHLRGLKVSKVMGNVKQRQAALHQDADIYVIGRDTFVWLVQYYKEKLPFDMIIIDELTSFKSPRSCRFKAMRIVAASAQRVVGLTGTPAPNGLLDLWAQIYCLDQGQRLGKSVTRYRDTYFHTITHNNIPIKSLPKPGSDKAIQDRIADICLSMQAKDYLQLPELITHTKRIPLSPTTRAKYNAFERERVMAFANAHKDEPQGIIANSAAGLMNKLSQFANGAVYDENSAVHEIHQEKLDVLQEIIEAANGESVLVFYQYKHDIPRICERLKGYNVQVYKDEATLKAWNAGGIDVLLAHPASTAYGLNMQQGGRYIVWFGLGWNLEYYQQANARLHRQGQQHSVIAYQLLCADTVDERAAAALNRKGNTQQALLDNLNDLLTKYNVTT